MKVRYSLLLLSLVALEASADCGKGKTTIFKCETAKGKQIQVCDDSKTIEYSFGKLSEKPEIVLNVPRNNVTTRQWDGWGTSEWYEIYVPNGKTTYAVYEAIHKSNQTAESGVKVIVDEKEVATVRCGQKSNVVSEIQGINLKSAAK